MYIYYKAPIAARVGQPNVDVGPGWREELEINHWKKTVPFAFAASILAVTQNYIVFDEEFILVFSTLGFGICTYTATADMLRKAQHEYGLKKWE